MHASIANDFAVFLTKAFDQPTQCSKIQAAHPVKVNGQGVSIL